MVRTSPARLMTLTALLALTVTLGGCSTISQFVSGGSAPERDEETNQVTEASDVDVFELEVGDCLQLDDATELSAAAVVPCDEPHTDEIYDEFEMPDGEWPGSEAVQTAASEGCYTEFEPFVGLPYEESVLDYSAFTPLEEGWNDPTLQDRMVQCVIYEPSAEGVVEVSGSLAGTAR